MWILLLAFDTANAQEPRFSIPQIQEDLRILADCLQALHPALDRHMSTWGTRQLLEELRRYNGEELNEVELLASVSRSLARLGCLHTTARASATSTQAALASPTLLPLGVEFAEGRVFVIHDLSKNSTIGSGSELIAIDGVDCQQLIAYMSRRQSADGVGGFTLTQRLAPLFLWHYRWRIGSNHEFRLKVREHGSESVLVVPGIDYATRQARRAARYPEFHPSADEVVSLEILGNGAAHLRVRSFYKEGGDGAWFKEQFAEVFARIQASGIQA